MPTRSGRKCLGSVTSGTAPQAGALQKVPPPSISVTSTALNDASILASAPAPPTCIAVTDSAASASTWPEHPSIPRAFPDAAGPAEAVEATLAPAPAPVASAAADAAAAGARACCSSCHGLSHASEAARRCREPRRTGVAFRDSPTGSGALHPALRLPPSSKVRFCDVVCIVGRAAVPGRAGRPLGLFLSAFVVKNARPVSGAGKRTAASGVARVGCAPLRGPLCAGEALLEARTQASVALFKLGAHSHSLRYAPTRIWRA